MRNQFATLETAWDSSQLLRGDPNDAEAWHTLGTTLAALGYRVAALVALRHALRLDDRRALTHRALGNLLFDTVRIEDALRCFDCAGAGIDA